MFLNEALNLGLSVDYKDRLIGEYVEVTARMKKLNKMIDDWINGKLDFTPKGYVDLYKDQYIAMEEYRSCLVERLCVEGIDIPTVG